MSEKQRAQRAAALKPWKPGQSGNPSVGHRRLHGSLRVHTAVAFADDSRCGSDNLLGELQRM